MPPSHAPTPSARRVARTALLGAALALLAGCTEPDSDTRDTADFSVRVNATQLTLVEGDPGGLTVPIELERDADHDAPITLGVEGLSDADVAELSGSVADPRLEGARLETTATLRLAIADRSIRPGQRRLRVTASDGRSRAHAEFDVRVEPVDAPDVYLLLGQSNMVGSSGEGTRRAQPGGPDEPDPRVLQLNVAPNNGSEVFTSAAAFRSPEINVAPPPIVVAEDPLHVPSTPVADGGTGKSAEYIGLGLSFAKRALGDTVRDVVLVPAAWSGSAFCEGENDPPGQWNARPPTSAVLGNTLLFDRALVRANAALARTGGILRGILWHQGESDANLPCAELYAENIALLAADLRTRIDPDPRGPALRAPDAPIPFVVGTMSRGVDERGDYSEFNAAKEMIDEVHRGIAEIVPHSAVSIHDDLVPANGYPCGQGDCIHFGPQALREMGVRYHAALGRALPR